MDDIDKALLDLITALEVLAEAIRERGVEKKRKQDNEFGREK